MHHVRHDVIEQALVVGDDDEGALRRPQGVHAVRDHLQRVDVETGIGLVEDAELGLEQRHLHDLVALLLTAGKADVERALQHLGRDVEPARGLLDEAHEVRRRDLALAARLALGVEGRLQEGHGGDARDLDRILEGEEEARRRALVRPHLQDRLAVEQDVAFGDLIVVLARQDIGQGRLAGAVRAHDGMDLAGLHDEVDALQDLGAVFGDAGMQVLDLEHGLLSVQWSRRARRRRACAFRFIVMVRAGGPSSTFACCGRTGDREREFVDAPPLRTMTRWTTLPPTPRIRLSRPGPAVSRCDRA
ncbi:hypothetical protein A6302_01449 [Methylobrevis pamukkalensis]|uniref:Uncharacterized protein n=1 Tax=Methylobrevis pamukkalensis TaxID=1439726 RepID=A0A1E3H4L2_9HYPH|nr:hypothetical protein A6302_01449 [Methylobrevis pamukkalensis]